MKDVKNRWINISCSWTGRINIMKMSKLPKEIYRFNALSIKLPMIFFTELEQAINSTICMEKWKTPNSWSNLEKEEWNWRNQTSWLQTILQSYSHQDSMVLAQNRNIDQWNKIESPETNLCIYGHLIFDRGGKNIQRRKGNIFNNKIS